MATATVAITDKGARASELRAQVATLTKELAQSKEKLELAQRTLGSLQEKRHKFTEDAAAGKQPKPGAVAALTVEIAEAEIPVEGLTRAVGEKQATLAQVSDSLAGLEREISLEARKTDRIEEVNALAAKGAEISARINAKLAEILEQDFPAFDEVRKSLRPFTFDLESRELADLARSADHAMAGAFMDGSFVAVERRLLRQGWTVKGDISLTIQNLRPPR